MADAIPHNHSNGTSVIWRENDTQSPEITATPHTCGEGSTLHIILVTTYISIAVSGIVGNILSFLVLHCKSCKNATNLLLKGLSLTDAVFGVCAILRVAFLENSTNTQCDSFIEVVLGNLVVRCVMTIAQFVSVWIIVVLAFFRYMAICHPFKVAQWCNRQTAKRAFVVVFTSGLLIWAPFMLKHDVIRSDLNGDVTFDDNDVINNIDAIPRSDKINDSKHNAIISSSIINHKEQEVNINVIINNELIVNNGVLTKNVITTDVKVNPETTKNDVEHNELNDVMTNNDVISDVNATSKRSKNKHNCYNVTHREWTKSKLYELYDGVFAHIGSMFIIPFIPLLFFNAGMMRELYCRQNKNRERLHVPKRTNEVLEITKVVIAIVIVFVVSYSMYLIYILHIYSSLLKQYLRQSCNAEDLFFFAIRTVALLNSSVNFVIYYVLRKSFRHKVKMLLCACYHQDDTFSPTRETSHNGPTTTHRTSAYSYRSVRRDANPRPSRASSHRSQKRNSSTSSKYS